MKRVFQAAGIAAVALSLVATIGDASAAPRKRQVEAYDYPYDHSITVTRRSWLDSGNVVPVGSTNAYVQEIIRFQREPLANYSPGVLWRPDPGPSEPIF
jgi:hypothetical protein